jgi:hypothetical protein
MDLAVTLSLSLSHLFHRGKQRRILKIRKRCVCEREREKKAMAARAGQGESRTYTPPVQQLAAVVGPAARPITALVIINY